MIETKLDFTSILAAQTRARASRMLEVRKPISVIAEVLGKTQNSIRRKMLKMGLLEQQQLKKSICCSSNDLKLPKELPCVEMALKILADAYEDGRLVWVVDGRRVFGG